MTKRILKAIDIFLDAINEGTLAKGDCRACAVGNLIRVCNNYSHDSWFKMSRYWKLIFSTDDRGVQDFVRDRVDFKLGKFPHLREEFSATGFTIEELAKIEHTFETNTNINFNMYWGFSKEEIRANQIKGLEAVVKVMLELDNEPTELVKELFTDKAELILV